MHFNSFSAFSFAICRINSKSLFCFAILKQSAKRTKIKNRLLLKNKKQSVFTKYDDNCLHFKAFYQIKVPFLP